VQTVDQSNKQAEIAQNLISANFSMPHYKWFSLVAVAAYLMDLMS
jgi:hypothetical protein